jgi:hypothetical protein
MDWVSALITHCIDQRQHRTTEARKGGPQAPIPRIAGTGCGCAVSPLQGRLNVSSFPKAPKLLKTHLGGAHLGLATGWGRCRPIREDPCLLKTHLGSAHLGLPMGDSPMRRYKHMGFRFVPGRAVRRRGVGLFVSHGRISRLETGPTYPSTSASNPPLA